MLETVPTVALLCALLPLAHGAAQDPSGPMLEEGAPRSLRDAVAQGSAWLQFFYRFETVDQDGFSKDAWASTLRSVLGYRTASYEGFGGLIEFEDVSVIGDDSYNSTTNGETDRPIVADPEGTELNQAYVFYEGFEDAELRLGRQRIRLDNDRHVGNVVWRQNEQTYDAASISSEIFDGVNVFYAYLENVNRIFGEASPSGDAAMDSHLLNVSKHVGELGKLTGYAYLLDYDLADNLSSNTFGARLVGKRELRESRAVKWALEYANQTDAADNPGDVDAGYYAVEVGGSMDSVSLKVGAEVLEGSGLPGDKFQTPLATLHAFNGRADVFLTTPDTGLEDVYLGVGATLEEVALEAIWHDFSANTGGADYGGELDVSATRALNKDVTVGLVYADYSADVFSVDTQKIWFWIATSF